MNKFHSAACLLVTLAFGACDHVVDKTFGSEAEIVAANGDCAVIDSLDVRYPVKVTAREEAQETIRFIHRGDPAYYSGWKGCRLIVLRTDHDGQQGVLVLRSPAEHAAQPPR